jgi:hypothetical protein
MARFVRSSATCTIVLPAFALHSAASERVSAVPHASRLRRPSGTRLCACASRSTGVAAGARQRCAHERTEFVARISRCDRSDADPISPAAAARVGRHAAAQCRLEYRNRRRESRLCRRAALPPVMAPALWRSTFGAPHRLARCIAEACLLTPDHRLQHHGTVVGHRRPARCPSRAAIPTLDRPCVSLPRRTRPRQRAPAP